MPGSVSKLPGDTPPFTLPSGTVRLFESDHWGGQTFDLKYNGNNTETANIEYNFVGSSLNDRATWLAFNLPKDVVITMTQDPSPRPNCANVAGCGRVVDLVGTGCTEGVDLAAMGCADMLSAWFWRYVDLSLGAVELYEHPNFGGCRTVIFLSDWHSGRTHSIVEWFLNDRCSSIKWTTLDDRITCTLWEHSKPDGDNLVAYGYSKVLAGYNEEPEDANLALSWRMDDTFSCFNWNGLVPKKEIIQPFQLDLTQAMSNTKSFTSTNRRFNETDMEQEFEVSLVESQGETLTVSTEDSSRVGFQLGMSYSVEVGIPFVASFSSTLSTNLSYDYSHTESTENSTTQTNTLSLTNKFKAAPWKTTVGTLIIRVGTVPRMPFETTAQRWYDIQVADSESDPDSPGWYKRDEIVKGHLEGGLRAEVQIQTYYEDSSGSPISGGVTDNT